MKYLTYLIPGMLISGVLGLSACTTSTESQTNAAKVYDTICAAEPGVYLITANLAQSNHWDASKIKKLNQAHVAVTRLCSDRPTNLIAGLVTLSAAYRDVLLMRNTSEVQA